MKSDVYSNGPYTGAIAEIDTNYFTLSKTLEVKANPFDIAVDENGNLYISSASGQDENIKIYSLQKNIEVPNSISGNVGLYAGTYIFYNSAASKLYFISIALSPNRLNAVEVNNGIPKQEYYDETSSYYKGLHPFVKVSPDGTSLYDNLGNVIESTMFESGDMVQRFILGKSYNDYAFSLQNGFVFGAA
ncbi:MAG: hypothetical protein Q8934_14570 [Bacillota bacterium]|nr:hypothetical protein [Bacillota bacterium]